MNFDFNYNFDNTQKVWNVAVSGEIDIYNSSELREHLTTLIEKSRSSISMDFHNLEYIDSTGLGTLVAILKKVKEYNGNVMIKNINSNVHKVFKITNLDKIFIIKEGDRNE